MPKNSNQVSNLDELEAQMQEQEEQEQFNPQVSNSQQEEQEPQKSNYTPNEGEKHLFHVELEKPLFSQSTGKRVSVPYVQKFTKAEYNQLVGKKSEKDKSNAEMLGYTVKVLWNPDTQI